MPLPNAELLQALAANNFAAAEQYARQIITAQPDDAPSWQALGVSQLRQNRPAEARAALEKAIALGCDGSHLRFDLACSLEQLGKLEEAVAQLRSAVAQDQQFGEAYIIWLLRKSSTVRGSLRITAIAVPAVPAHPRPLQFGGCAAIAGEFDKPSPLIPKPSLTAPPGLYESSSRELLSKYATGWTGTSEDSKPDW